MTPNGSPPRPRARVSNPQPDTVPRLKIAVGVVIATVVLVVSLYGWHQFEAIPDSRFAFRGQRPRRRRRRFRHSNSGRAARFAARD